MKVIEIIELFLIGIQELVKEILNMNVISLLLLIIPIIICNYIMDKLRGKIDD